MKLFSRINNITGWLIFALAASVYLYTMEPTVSLWDCGEFLSASYKLQVGHPPGAPFYLMLARIFSLFAPDKSSVAFCINALSAIASAFTVMFLFWTITHLARRVFTRDSQVKTWNMVKIFGCATVGSLAFSFSDSFWFSATEAEVYAFSSLLTALVFWCVLKWDEDPSPYANRWLIIIAYLMGLSIGVHLLNLLAIPAIVMVVWFRKYGGGWKKSILALFISFLVLFGVLYVVIPGTIKLASYVEVLFVNWFHLPVNTGLAATLICAVFGFLAFSAIANRKGKVVLNAILLCLAVLIIGYSSYAMVVIRANSNPALNTGNPSNAFSLLSYLNRDKYVNASLFYGQYFNAPILSTNAITENYTLKNGTYVKIYSKGGYLYDSNYMTLFPRMYSANENHIKVYIDWGGINRVKVKKDNGTYQSVLKPNFGNNLQSFFTYQVGYMYMRYFMWNFVGKQNDMQGNGGIMKGNWISGFDFLDKWMIGAQSLLPKHMKGNPGRNIYFFLPLLLGVAGFIFHFTRSRRYFFIIVLLFTLTGLAIVVYTNQTPLQPRERDYVYVGSFYAFCIWAGLGTLWIINLLHNILNRSLSIIFGITISLSIPALMFAQNFDDHNRHGRTMVRDIAYNYLNSCAPNSFLFTYGDNDTYPLWYLQEVEGIRTDVRVVNMSLLNTHWYINQQRRKVYNSEAIPWSLPDSFYHSNKWVMIKREYSALPLDSAMKQIKEKGIISSDKIFLINNNDSLILHLSRNYVPRNELVILDFLASSELSRPIYFASATNKAPFGFNNYLQQEGFVYRLTANYTVKDEFPGRNIDIDLSYEILMKNSEWNEWTDKKGMMDDHLRNILAIMKVRQNYATLALALSKEGKNQMAEEVLDRSMQIMPPSEIPYDHYCIQIAEGYIKCGATKKADKIIGEYGNQLREELQFYASLPAWIKGWVSAERAQAKYYFAKLKNVKTPEEDQL